MSNEPDQIDMMDADELRVELRKLVKQITPPPERGSQPHSVGWSEGVGELEAEMANAERDERASSRAQDYQATAHARGRAEGLRYAIETMRSRSSTESSSAAEPGGKGQP